MLHSIIWENIFKNNLKERRVGFAEGGEWESIKGPFKTEWFTLEGERGGEGFLNVGGGGGMGFLKFTGGGAKDFLSQKWFSRTKIFQVQLPGP